jgi:hypothetical protein
MLPLTHEAGRAAYRNSTRCPTVKPIDFLPLFAGIVTPHQRGKGHCSSTASARAPRCHEAAGAPANHDPPFGLQETLPIPRPSAAEREAEAHIEPRHAL